MKKILLIARHGNTFEKDQAPLRIGARTDMPLTQEGKAQAARVGQWIRQNPGGVDQVYTGTLKRVVEFGQIVVDQLDPTPVCVDTAFNEIDYGLDEGKTEAQVNQRIGCTAMKQWDEAGIAPPGWAVDTDQIKNHWKAFAEQYRHSPLETLLVVTSNGIARFAPCITPNGPVLKMSTGALSCLAYADGVWSVVFWNHHPENKTRNT